ncbi:Initiation factor eIF-4 gamma MA3 [Gracilaria domingensis]|nr:Initiation factor eIF-4 gamma MA3 [Gracilaria domingensis]
MLHDGHLGRRAQVAIENLLILRRNRFRDLPSTDPRLDLLHDKDIFTHGITLEEDLGDLEYECDNFQFDRKYEENEKAYLEIKKEILGAAMDQMPPELGEDPSRPQSDRMSNPTAQAPESNTNNNKDPNPIKTTDLTNTDLLNFRRTVYLTHSATLSAEESAHRMFLLMRENKGKEAELCKMIIECCSQESSYQKVYGNLAHRICYNDRSYRAHFEELFADRYATIHRFDTRKIRIIACLFAFLLAEEAISWNILEVVRIVEEETTASSRTFLKYLFQQLRENMGKTKTKERFLQADKDGNLKGVFPTDCAKNARFAINMFTTIGLGFLTDGLRDKLKDIPDQAAGARQDERDTETSTSSSSLSSSSSELSPSIGDEHPQGDLSDDNGSRGLKRQQDEASRLDSERPTKFRRLERSASRRGERESRRRRDIRQNIELDDIERNHRAYVNSSSGSRSRRYAPEQSDEDERDYHSKSRRGPYPSRRGEGSRRDRPRSSRLMSHEYREGYRSDEEALRRSTPRDRHGRHRSDLDEYDRGRRDEHRDVSPGYDEPIPMTPESAAGGIVRQAIADTANTIRTQSRPLTVQEEEEGEAVHGAVGVRLEGGIHPSTLTRGRPLGPRGAIDDTDSTSWKV